MERKTKLNTLVCHCNPRARESRQEDSWGSLDNQSTWFRQLWVQWETLSQKSDEPQLRKEININLWPSWINTHVHMNICTYTQINNMLCIFESFQQLGLSEVLWSFRCLQHASLPLIKESLRVFSFAGPQVVKSSSHCWSYLTKALGIFF